GARLARYPARRKAPIHCVAGETDAGFVCHVGCRVRRVPAVQGETVRLSIALGMQLISCERVSKIFHRNAGQKLMRHHVADAFRKRSTEHDFYALKNVTFQMMNGESLAVVGSNGACRSTR